VPVQVVFLRPDEFPRTNTGKVQKAELRQVMAAHLGHPSAP
jgi:acyl-coenzyme A synthetase/AMP-(fatty) acid ligase